VTSVAINAPSRLGLLHQRNFRLLWTGETTSQLGSSVTSVALPLVALSVLHASVFAVSLLSAVAWAPWLVIGLPAGAWVDRLRRRPVMIVADLISILAFASVPATAVLGWLTITQLLIVAAISGCAAVFFETAHRAFLPAVVAAADILEANATLQGSEQVTHIAGPGLAGLIAQLAGPIGGLIADAASFTVSAFCLTRLDVDEPRLTPSNRHLRHEIAEGIGIVWHNPLLRTNAVCGCLSNLTLIGYQSIQIVFLVRVVGLSAALTGLLLAAASVGGVIGALMARSISRRFGSARSVLALKIGLMPFGVLIAATHTGPRIAFFLVANVVVIAGIVAGNIIWSGWMQASFPSQLLGRISTSMQVVNFGALPLGAVLAGVTATAIGIRPTVLVMLSGLVLASTVLLFGPLRTMRDLPEPPSRDVE
jgi:MFS family permease